MSSHSSLDLEDTVSTNSSSNLSAKTSQVGGKVENWEDFSEEIFEKTQLCQRYAYLNRNISTA